MRKNVELEKLYKDVNIATFIKLQRDIHNDWMMQENTWKIYQATSHQRRRQGRPTTRWKYDAKNDMLTADKQKRVDGEQRLRCSSVESQNRNYEDPFDASLTPEKTGSSEIVVPKVCSGNPKWSTTSYQKIFGYVSEIKYLSIFRKTVHKIKISYTSDKINGYFTSIPMYTYIM
jgi:hypothetical protein